MLFEKTFNKILDSYDQKCQAIERMVSLEYGPDLEVVDVDRHTLAETRCESIDVLREVEKASQQIDLLNKSTALGICARQPLRIGAIIIDVAAFIVGGPLAIVCGLFAIFLVALLVADLWTLHKALSVRPGSPAYFVHAILGLHRNIKQSLDQAMGL